MDEQIRNWIMNQKNNGVSDSQIKSMLLSRGWKEDAIAPLLIQRQKTSAYAIVSLILSFLLPSVTMIISIFGIRDIIRKNQSGKGMIIAGLLIQNFLPIMGLFFMAWYFLQFPPLIIGIITSIVFIVGMIVIYQAMTKKKNFGWAVTFCIIFFFMPLFCLGCIVYFGVLDPTNFLP